MPDFTQDYDEAFYKRQAEKSYNSAKKTLALFTKYYKPHSVIDLGCGVGTWLKAWSEYGVEEICGIDGNTIDDRMLYIPRAQIQIDNLEKHHNQNNRRFDLSMSLEVAEHLSPLCSKDFVKNLTSYSDIVLFSAAIPHQPGTHHINCRPLQFWVDLFQKEGYVCFDFLRHDLMYMFEEVNSNYAQNILVFVKAEKADIFTSQGLSPVSRPIFYYNHELVEMIIYNIHQSYPFQRRLKLVARLISKMVLHSLAILLPVKAWRHNLYDLYKS